MRVRVGNFPQSKRKTSTKVGVFLCPQTSRPDHQGKLLGCWKEICFRMIIRKSFLGYFQYKRKNQGSSSKHSWVKKCEINLEILRTEKHSWVTLEDRRKNSPRHFTGLTSQESFLILLDFFEPPNLFVFFLSQ